MATHDTHAQLWKIADQLQMDLRNATARLIELRALISAPDYTPPPQNVCPDCGIRFKGAASLAEHRYYSHNGPTPEHWGAIEALTALDPEPGNRQASPQGPDPLKDDA